MTPNVDSEERENHSCLRGLRRYKLGEDFSKWVLNFYQEMVEKKLHSYFPYDDRSKLIAKLATDKLAKIKETGTEAEKAKSAESELEQRMLADSYLIRCLAPDTVQSLEAKGNSADVGFLWLALIEQCQSSHKHTLREAHQQLIKIKMRSTESLVAYQGRTQQLTKRLAGTNYEVKDAHKWGILTNGLPDAYKTIVRMINLSFDELPYYTLVTKLQDLAREDVGDPNIPMERQQSSGISSAALSTMERSTNDSGGFKRKFKGKEKSPTIALEAVIDYNLWIWHDSFGFPRALKAI